MAGIEDAARELGLTDLRLGTGDAQPEAIALYASSGWERVFVGRDGRPVPAAPHLVREAARPVTLRRAPFDVVCAMEPGTTPDLIVGCVTTAPFAVPERPGG